MKISFSNWIVIWQVFTLFFVNFAAKIWASEAKGNVCELESLAAASGFYLVFMELCIIIILRILKFIPYFRAAISKIWTGFIFGFAISLLLMTPACLVIHKEKGLVIGSFNPNNCFDRK